MNLRIKNHAQDPHMSHESSPNGLNGHSFMFFFTGSGSLNSLLLVAVSTGVFEISLNFLLLFLLFYSISEAVRFLEFMCSNMEPLPSDAFIKDSTSKVNLIASLDGLVRR